MKLFDFRCDDCGYIEEHFINNGGADAFVCPECEGEMFRVISAPRVISMGEEASAYKELKAIEKRKQNKTMYF